MEGEAPKRCSGITEGHERVTGQVKWYDTTKGFGFIGRENEKDTFVHISAIWSEDTFPRRPVLLPNETVEFYVADTPKGNEAREVSLVGGVIVPKRSIHRFFRRNNQEENPTENNGEAPAEGEKPRRRFYRRNNNYRRNYRKNNNETAPAAEVPAETVAEPETKN
ncbi:hypothetical protein WA158_001764 [Blastocystis sp. Blastoise]